MPNDFISNHDALNSGLTTSERPPVSEDTYYKQDSFNKTNGVNFGLWCKRLQADVKGNYFVEAGTGIADWVFPTSRRYATFTFQWFEKQGFTWFRDHHSCTDSKLYETFPAGYKHDPFHFARIIKHGAERGFTYWQISFLNSTRDILAILTDDEIAKLGTYWWVAQAKEQWDKDMRIAKLAISLGLHAHVKKIVEWCKEWCRKQSVRLEEVKQYCCIEVWNEILGWEPVDPRAKRARHAELEPFAINVMGWKPIDTTMFQELVRFVRDELGFSVLDEYSVHGYYDWMEDKNDPTNPALNRVTRFYLGMPEVKDKPIQFSEGNADVILDEKDNDYGDWATEYRRLWYDSILRGSRRFCVWTACLISSARRHVVDPKDSYGQFRSSTTALSWLGKDPIPKHEGVCVLDEAKAEVIKNLNWSTRF